MPTVEEIRGEWKGIRSALGNLICYVDGKTENATNSLMVMMSFTMQHIRFSARKKMHQSFAMTMTAVQYQICAICAGSTG